MGKVKDLTGNQYGRLTVIERQGTLHKRAAWLCQCECGGAKVVSSNDLQKKNTTSCGCAMRERALKHGKSYSRLFNTWNNMKDRCLNPKNQAYHYYGGRGITVCNEWLEFTPFEEWAITNGYTEKLTIDRIDSNGNYEPINCRWATRIVQQNNRSNNHLILINGEQKTIAEWARVAGIDPRAMGIRINRLGWTGEKLLKPARKKVPKEI